MKSVRIIPNFPKPGQSYIDITPLLADAKQFASIIDTMAYAAPPIDIIAGIEARGYIFAAALAAKVHCGFLAVPKNAAEWTEIPSRQRVLLVDDTLATGRTAARAISQLQAFGATVAGLSVLIEFVNLQGRQTLPGIPVQSLLKM